MDFSKADLLYWGVLVIASAVATSLLRAVGVDGIFLTFSGIALGVGAAWFAERLYEKRR